MHTGRASRETGFTLVEIAIVLVIIGLILGGVLKGQELVTSARVRNIADQQNAIKAAFFAFQDRYKAIPGDYLNATQNIPGLSSGTLVDGDGDGFIASSTTVPKELSESVWAFLHLANAGFISCSQCITGGNVASPVTASATNSPVNAFGGVLSIFYDNQFGQSPGSGNAFNGLRTGSNIPSNILAEVDNKLDDGNPYTGSFQFSPFTAGPTAPTAASCVVGTAVPYNWNRQTPATNCGAAYTF
jgi:prepilin-type N-terminal cleavage/methylation domain-containing protein